jgi:hypothetical protein
MEPSEILEALLDIARQAGLEVRGVGRSGLEAAESPPASGVVRVRGDVWVMLSSADPVAVQLDVLAGALRTHAADAVADRYLPPAVRALLDK